MLGSHVAVQCQADPTFAAYPYSPRAFWAAVHAAADDLRRIISILAGVCVSQCTGRCELDIFIVIE